MRILATRGGILVSKFNPNHDARGRFTFRGGGGSFSGDIGGWGGKGSAGFTQDLVQTSQNILQEHGVLRSIVESQMGMVAVGSQNMYDRLYDSNHPYWQGRGQEIYNAYQPVRDKLRERFGETVPLYRVDPGTGSIPNKHTLFYSDAEFAAKFERAYGGKAVKYDVKVADIIAMPVSVSGRYREFVVWNHESVGGTHPQEPLR